jgi:hypothetical protein
VTRRKTETAARAEREADERTLSVGWDFHLQENASAVSAAKGAQPPKTAAKPKPVRFRQLAADSTAEGTFSHDELLFLDGADVPDTTALLTHLDAIGIVNEHDPNLAEALGQLWMDDKVAIHLSVKGTSYGFAVNAKPLILDGMEPSAGLKLRRKNTSLSACPSSASCRRRPRNRRVASSMTATCRRSRT